MQIKFLILSSKKTESKVNDFNIIIFINHYVIQFYIAMSNFFRVQVLNPHNNSPKYFLGLLFWYTLLRFWLQVLVEWSLSDVFHDKDNLFACVDGCI